MRGQGRTIGVDTDTDRYQRNIEKGLSYQVHVDDLKELLQVLKTSSKVILAGLSLGESVALEFAAQNPETYLDLVLLSPVVSPLAKSDCLGQFRLRY